MEFQEKLNNYIQYQEETGNPTDSLNWVSEFYPELTQDQSYFSSYTRPESWDNKKTDSDNLIEDAESFSLNDPIDLSEESKSLASDIVSQVSQVKPKSIVSSDSRKIKESKDSADDFLKNNFDKVVQTAKQYNIDPIFVLTIMSIETGYGKSLGYKSRNIGFNMKGNKGNGFMQKDVDSNNNSYSALYNAYDSIEDSIEDFCQWVIRRQNRQNYSGTSVDDLIHWFAHSGFAEGVNDPGKNNAKEKLNKTYSDVYKSVTRRLKRLGYIE